MNSPVILATSEMPWDLGREAVGLAPGTAAFEGSPPAHESPYQTKTFHHNATTGERGFVARAPSGHSITHRYHHSAEESFVLSGSVDLRSEGMFTAGCYFWRPPGWVHASNRTDGWEAITFSVGADEREGSAVHSDVLCAPEQEGTNQLHRETSRAVGPRGWVRHLDSALLPWQPGRHFARAESSTEALCLDLIHVKVLSRNVHTGSLTALIRVEKGEFLAPTEAMQHDLKLFALEGMLSIGDRAIQPGTFVHGRAGSTLDRCQSHEVSVLLLKSDSWLNVP